jgi:hypothetical protein
LGNKKSPRSSYVIPDSAGPFFSKNIANNYVFLKRSLPIPEATAAKKWPEKLLV